MRSSTILIAALLLTASASGAAAQPAKPAAPKPAAAAPAAPAAAPPATPGEGDARCLLSMAVLSQDKQRQQAASIGVFFYAGRLTARGLDITTAVREAEAKLTPPQIPAELKRCGPAVQGAQAALQKTFAPPPSAQAPAPGAAPPAAAPAAPTPK